MSSTLISSRPQIIRHVFPSQLASRKPSPDSLARSGFASCIYPPLHRDTETSIAHEGEDTRLPRQHDAGRGIRYQVPDGGT